VSGPRKRPFVAIDGEAWTLGEDHRYVLLMDSHHRHIVNPEGIPTKQCFEFLLDLPAHSIPVAFGLNYDVNMMLRDFGKARLKELWKEGACQWFDYKVEWVPGKWFKVTHGKRKVRIFEVFGFFQARFVKALEDWNIPVQDNEELEEMKASRSTFDESMLTRIIEYCHTECRLLVQLMEGLRDALLHVDISLRTWNGAGAIAAAILSKEGVKTHLVRQDDLSPPVAHACLSAYFGGRTELFRQGCFPRVSQFDICSAYPWAATYLPSLTNAKWRRYKVYSLRHEHAIWHVTWDIPDGATLGPFPYRAKGGRICYPLNGRGWYHAIEVDQARRLYPDHIRVHEGWALIPGPDDGTPFNFIAPLYAYRRQLKLDGLAAEKCLKLGINSLYGKLAQGIGYKDHPPPFQSYFWAGEITARTRARMLSIASQHPERLIMLATDGVFFAGDVSLDGEPIGTELGDLERGTITDAFTAQPGVYTGIKDDTIIKRSRGFFAKEIDFDVIKEGSESVGPYFVGRYASTRFQGLGTSLMRRDMSMWRTWVTQDRKLILAPQVKTIIDPDERPVRHAPPRLSAPVIPSLPYAPKHGHADDDDEYRQGKDQPLRG
jgi:hypothetical protein